MKDGLLNAFLVLCLLSGSCSASYIQMTVSVAQTEVVTEDSFPLNVTVLNTGDEPAYDVQVDLVLPEGFTAEPAHLGVLNPNAPQTHSYTVSVNDSVKPGTYAVVLKTHYTDANAYPFSTISPLFIRYMNPTPFRLRGAVEELKITPEQGGDLRLEVSNLDEKPHDVTVRLHLPDELAANYYVRDIEVPARGISRLSFPVKSFGALPGSSYVVFATMDYAEEDFHYSAAANGMVSIVEAGEGGLPPWTPLLILAALVVVLLYYQVRR